MIHNIKFIIFLLGFVFTSQSLAENTLEAVNTYQLALTYDKCLSNKHKADCPDKKISSDKVVELIKKSASMEYAEAQYTLGWMYVYGHRVTKNTKEAARLITKAANNNLPKAQHFLSYMASNGIGMPEDKDLALKWMLIASKNGDKNSQEILNKLSQPK